MALLALLTAMAAAGESAAVPRLQVAEGIDCPTRAQIQRALDQHFGDSPAPEGSDGTPLLEVLRDEAGQLSVRLSSSTAKPFAEKTLDARTGSCTEVAETIALLAGSWLADLAPVPEVPPAAPNPPPAVVEAHQVVARRVDAPYRFSLWLAAEAVFGPGVGFGGGLAVDLSLPRRFGLGLQLTVPGSLSGTDTSGGTMTVDRQVLALFATFALIAPTSERSPTVAVLVGPTLLHYSAQAQGYPQSSSAAGLEPGLIFGIRGSVPMFQGFFAYGELDGTSIASALNFQVAEASGQRTTVVTQPSFWGSLSLGVGVQFL